MVARPSGTSWGDCTSVLGTMVSPCDQAGQALCGRMERNDTRRGALRAHHVRAAQQDLQAARPPSPRSAGPRTARNPICTYRDPVQHTEYVTAKKTHNVRRASRRSLLGGTRCIGEGSGVGGPRQEVGSTIPWLSAQIIRSLTLAWCSGSSLRVAGLPGRWAIATRCSPGDAGLSPKAGWLDRREGRVVPNHGRWTNKTSAETRFPPGRLQSGPSADVSILAPRR